MDIKGLLLDNLEELFGERFELIERTTEAVNLSDIPSALHCFYKKYSFLKMPLGSIFTVEEARKMSYQQPFLDEEWFCFGQDNYGFVFWLCKEVDGRTFFNAWDHEMSDYIDEGMEITLEEFLQDIINDFEENETCSIEIKSCEEDALAELVKIKKAFNMTASMSELKEIKHNLPYVISDDFSYMKALNILKDLKLDKVKIDVFHID
ncbi:MAG: hypothetical protein U0K86_03640 [Agathobacter sp.]|nr:hypothetical protein [Agathobacter sp.]